LNGPWFFPQTSFWGASALWLLLGLLLTLQPSLARAHGGGTPQLAGVVAGPYRLFAWTTPEPWRVGEVHTTIAVTQPDAAGRDTPISGAQVTVIYALADGAGAPIQVTATEGSGAQAGFYEADAALPASGVWQVTVQVIGPAGGGEASFVNSVLPAESGVNWWLVGAGAFVLALVVGGWLVLRRSKPQQGEPGAQQPAGS
jgi:hypothetical protein